MAGDFDQLPPTVGAPQAPRLFATMQPAELEPGMERPQVKLMDPHSVVSASLLLNQQVELREVIRGVPGDWEGTVEVMVSGRPPCASIRADLLRAFLKRCDDDIVARLKELGVDVDFLEPCP